MSKWAVVDIVRVNTITPGFIHPPMTSFEGAKPGIKAGQPDELSGAVVFLCSEAASGREVLTSPLDLALKSS